MGERRFEGQDHAAAYIKYRVSPQELVTKIMDFMEEKGCYKPGIPYNLAMDVGCGSGQGTILLAPHFAKVLGTDVSHAQLEMAQTKDTPPNVSYRQCPAEELPLADGEADLVTAMTAAHWFDRPRFLQEAYRVLRSGGCLALLSYTMDMELEYRDMSSDLNAICEEFYDTLRSHRSAYIGVATKPIYKDMFDSCPYPDKEWNECLKVRRSVTLSGYIRMLETFSNYQSLLAKDVDEALRISKHFESRLLTAMGVSSPDTEVVVVYKFWCWLACKP